MELSLIVNIILSVIVVVSAVSWGVLFTKGRNIWANMKELHDEYVAAVADGIIQDSEKIQIADTIIEIIGDAADIWQMLENFGRAVLKIARKGK